jgi:hypothetical protein
MDEVRERPIALRRGDQCSIASPSIHAEQHSDDLALLSMGIGRGQLGAAFLAELRAVPVLVTGCNLVPWTLK